MKLIILVCTLFVSVAVTAQVATSSDLYKQIQQLDNVVFELGFNKCDLKPTEALLAADFEFYHDIGGTQNKAEFLKAMQENICGNPEVDITRKLIDGSMEVFPLKRNNKLYGVLQRGEHEFYRQEKGQEKMKTGYAKYTSYWELEGETWMLKRTFSFDHKARH